MTAQEIRRTQGQDSAGPSSLDLRAPQIVTSGGTASLHLTLAICDYEHVREITPGNRARRRHRAHAADLPVDRGDHLPLHPQPRMGRLGAVVREIHLAHFAGRGADGGDPGVPVARAPAFGDLRARATAASRPRQGPGRPHRRHSGMGADRRHLCARLSGRGLRRRSLARCTGCRPASTSRAAPRRSSSSCPRASATRRGRTASLSAMLASGEVDAVISARAPDASRRRRQGGAAVPELSRRGGALFKKTGIFPIMHLMTMRRAGVRAASLDRDEPLPRCSTRPSAAASPGCAISPARASRCHGRRLWSTRSLPPMAPIPSPTASSRAARRIEAFLRYCHDQGVTHRRMTVEDLFPREVRAMAKV